LGKLRLILRKNALDGYSQYVDGLAGMKKHLDGDPIGNPPNKAGDQD
jgi:hypothetical protein